MEAVEPQQEITDVALCYQSMGVPLDASPEQIEQAYRSITEEYKRQLTSGTPAQREEARVSLELMKVMYDKIRASVTYTTRELDYLKKGGRQLHRVTLEKRNMINCPRCNALISRNARSCSICKSPIYGPVEKVFRELFTVKKIIVYCVILCAVIFGVLRVLGPELFSGKKNTDVEAPLEK